MNRFGLLVLTVALLVLFAGCGANPTPPGAGPAPATPPATAANPPPAVLNTATATTPPSAPTATATTAPPAATATSAAPTATSAPSATPTTAFERPLLDQEGIDHLAGALPPNITGLLLAPGLSGPVSVQNYATSAKADHLAAGKADGLGDMFQARYINPAGQQNVIGILVGIAPLSAAADGAKALGDASNMAADVVTNVSSQPFDFQANPALKDLFEAGNHLEGIIKNQSTETDYRIDVFRKKNAIVWTFTYFVPGADAKPTELASDDAAGKALQTVLHTPPVAPPADVISRSQVPALVLRADQAPGLKVDTNTGWWVAANLAGAGGNQVAAGGLRGVYSFRLSGTFGQCSICSVASTFYLFPSADAAKAALQALVDADKAQFPNSTVSPNPALAPDAVIVRGPATFGSSFTIWQFKNGLNEVWVSTSGAVKDSDVAKFADAVAKTQQAFKP